MNEQTTTNIQHSHFFINGMLRWISIVLGIITIISALYGLFLIRNYMPIVGLIWLIAICALPAIGIIFLLVFIAKYATKPHVIHLQEYGTVIGQFHSMTAIAPMSQQKLLTEKNTSNTPIDTTIEELPIDIPTLIEVFQDNIIPPNKLLHGHYLKDALPYLGTWQDIRSFVIAGKSRSGKTVVVSSYIMQALLAHAVIFCNDPHFRKGTGLLKVLEPLWPYMTVGRTIEEILQNAHNFINEMEARLNGQSTDLTPWIFFCDEWSHLLRNMEKDDKDFIVKLVLNANEAYAGVNGFCCISGHEWTARESGGSYGAAIRRGFHATIVLRLDTDYANFLLTGANKKLAKLTPNLRTGTGYLQDSEGDIHLLGFSYYGDNKEAIYEVARMLEPQLEEKIPVMDQLTYTGKQDIPLLQAPLDQTTPNTEELEVSNEVNVVKYIHRLRKRNIGHRDISYMLGMYGPTYDKYQELCRKYSIALD